MTDPRLDREANLERIRQTYATYRTEGRDQLWDPANRGYARMMRNRDRALVDLIGRSLPAGGSVLDVGSGPGELADVAKAMLGGVQWTGVDLLPESVAQAKKQRGWATWVEASADRMPFDDASFDVVVAATLFSSLPSAELERATASEIGRVLRPDGWLVWYDLRYSNPRNRAVHGVNGARLARLFPHWRAELRTCTVVPPLARRLGVLTSLLYSLLESMPPLRSHLVGRLSRE